ncbi:hypothetical protein BDV59DRAFT_3275 [Aspergillus ambiguus]|uniref:YciI family protein n=1 Tax=Aspergillus ambiguus TaxID=176160 RepID=UPI003CCE38B5
MSFYRFTVGRPTLSIPRGPVPHGLRYLRPLGRCTIATAGPGKKEFLCILPDKPDAVNLRLQVRPTHLEAVKPLVASGRVVAGGAMVDKHPARAEKVPFRGSMMIYTGETAEDVWKVLTKDIYATSGVWDLEKAQVIPFISAIREPLA